MRALKAVEQAIAGQIKAVCGARVEVTARGIGQWTVSGAPADVAAAVRFLGDHKLMRLDSTEHDDELGESFAYLLDKTAAA